QQFASSLHHAIGDELVGEWKFDSDTATEVVDTSGWGNNGSYEGGLSLSDHDDGVMGLALKFNGTSDYVRAALSVSSQEITACGWIKPDTSFSGKKGFINGGYQFHLWINGDGTFNYGAWTSSGNEEYKSTEIHNLDNWFFVCVVNKGKEYTKLYVDGQHEEENSLVGDLNNITYFDFARHPNHNFSFFDGFIDDVRIYSKALTTAQIQKHYAEGLKDHPTLASK
ncbi:MAG: LamG domain-containing protein, partial [Candidatus Aenigmarchaeota archaeon]|nr:LamG domain-containing protein [Candidatus Aenigmarchaeota archaeon]